MYWLKTSDPCKLTFSTILRVSTNFIWISNTSRVSISTQAWCVTFYKYFMEIKKISIKLLIFFKLQNSWEYWQKWQRHFLHETMIYSYIFNAATHSNGSFLLLLSNIGHTQNLTYIGMRWRPKMSYNSLSYQISHARVRI